MKNFLDLATMTEETLLNLIIEALSYKNNRSKIPNINKFVSLLFLEPSTRTKTSFEVAAIKLGCKVITIDEQSSALQKGETLQDTLDTLAALDISTTIIRSTENFFYQNIQTDKMKIINAGDGTHAHPSQTLLDLVTIYEQFGYFKGLKLLIMGDIKHSRVARSNIDAMQRLGINVFVYAPEIYKTDENYKFIDNLDQNLGNYDVVMLLRNQLERHESEGLNIQDTYLDLYGLNKRRCDLLKEECIILHPGPFNRDIEISSLVLTDKKCRIYEQVKNGLYTRMAILNYVLGE